jgi:hypothetical protein
MESRALDVNDTDFDEANERKDWNENEISSTADATATAATTATVTQANDCEAHLSSVSSADGDSEYSASAPFSAHNVVHAYERAVDFASRVFAGGIFAVSILAIVFFAAVVRNNGAREARNVATATRWMDVAKEFFMTNASKGEDDDDDGSMFPTILEEIHKDASACDARTRAAQVPYFHNRHCAYLGRLRHANMDEERRNQMFEHSARDLESRFARNYIKYIAETNAYRLRGMGKTDWGIDEDAEEKLGMFPSNFSEETDDDDESFTTLAEESVVDILANSEEKVTQQQQNNKRRRRRDLLKFNKHRSRLSKHSSHLINLVRIGKKNHLVVLTVGAKEAPLALACARAFRKHAVPGVARIFEGSPQQFFALERMKLALPNHNDAKRLRLISSFVGKTRKTKSVNKNEVFGSIGDVDWERTKYFGTNSGDDLEKKNKVGTSIELLQISPREAMIGGIPIILSAADELQSEVLDGLASGVLKEGIPAVVIMRAHALGFAPEFSQRFPYFVYAIAQGTHQEEEAENKDEPESIELFRVDHLVWSNELANIAKNRRVLLIAFARDSFEPFRKWANEKGLFACGDCDTGKCFKITRSEQENKCKILESQKGMDVWADELRALIKMRDKIGF